MPTSETSHNIETLNELEHLKRSGFGKPPPRHGLNLLHWFAKEYVYVYNPQNEEFGFHLFDNKPVDNGYRLLPDIDQPYYIVGNLNKEKMKKKFLPDYFYGYYTGELDDSNTDRIIVSHNFDRIYVTKHINQWNFNPRATYRISKGLLYIISRMNRIYFLNEMGYDEEPTAPPNYNSSQWIMTNNFNPSTPQEYQLDMPEEQGQASQQPPVEPPSSGGLWSKCTIL